jgi:putative tricarboxylic transport membrane protein
MVIEGLRAIMNASCLTLMLLGTTIGIVFGAIPGLTATMAVALCLPITYALAPTLSIAFLISLYVGGISGGLISAILLNIPGTPSSVCTTFDGAPMSRQGRGGKALGVALVSSLFGTLFSVMIMIFIAPNLARLALKFGPYEYFSVCFFAMMILSTVVAQSMLKGITATTFGILIAMVGVAPVGNAIRFTFGFTELNLGFSTISVLIGLFAVADILRASIKKPEVDLSKVIKDYKIKGFGFRFREIKGQWLNALRSAIIGIGIGILPGVGGSASNVIAYTVAKQSSKYPDKFGTGIIDGVVASETANNASIGGAMIPLLTLGIPGDGSTAILLGGLTMAGITPGPLLFVNNATIVYSIYFALLIAAFMMFLMELFGMRMFVKILKVPKYYLLPIIISLCVVGVFGRNNQLFDVAALIVFGVIGFIMLHFKFPVSPFILGFVLGKHTETYLIRSIQYSRGNLLAGFASSPIAIGFLSATVIAVTYVIITKLRAASLQ